MAGRRRALIVANGEYDNAGLQRLGSPAADADALAGVLSDRAISDFDVRVVRNETAHVVQAEVEDLCAEGRPDDVLLLHFSCHGLKDDSGQLFFAARNTRPDRLRSTAVPAHFVQQCLRQSRSRSVVLLLDCCYGGAFGQGVAVRASGDANVLDSFRGGRGRAVITASNSIEYAFEGARLAEGGVAQPSVFTSALVEGLRTGEADRDEDGWIALGELYEYLFDRVRERNPKQTPSRDIEMQGELYLARSRRRRIKPSPIPADLAAAIEAENPFTRLGAVAELRRRLTSSNLEVAVGAFEALKVMSSTDVQHVAEAAEDARADAAIRADVEALRFEDDVPVRRIRLLGPPVARACQFEPSHDWMEIRETPEGAEVTVTRTAEARQGKVVVSGPTGESVIVVEAAAVAEEPAAVRSPEVDEPLAVPEVWPPWGRFDAAPAIGSPAEPVTGSGVAAGAPPSAEGTEVDEPAGTPEGRPDAAPASGSRAEPVTGSGVAAGAPPSAEGTEVDEPVGTPEVRPDAAPATEPESVAVAESPAAWSDGDRPVEMPDAAPAIVPAGEPVAELALPDAGTPEREPPVPGAARAPSGAGFGLLCLAGGVLALVAMAFEFHYSLGGSSRTLAGAQPGFEWYVWVLGVSAIVAGALPVLRAGAGWVAGVGAAAVGGLGTVVVIENGYLTDGGRHLGAGFGFLFAGLLAVAAAGVGVVWLVRGELHHRRPGRTAWTALALGLFGGSPVIVHFAILAGDEGSSAAAVLGFLTFAVPVGATLFVPPRFGGQALVGWALGDAAVAAAVVLAASDGNYANIVPLGLELLVIVVAGVLLIRRNQPNGRHS
ncbi:caspase family protein [Amycolatopsis sp. NPDC088138]|uniref:caspase, EACC1-associated type n=1 Tax=Amycolatopsis sp. NPDC088138 TaxID=3363938 RepID=UPI00382ACCE0